jgi:hypothetical protein
MNKSQKFFYQFLEIDKRLLLIVVLFLYFIPVVLSINFFDPYVNFFFRESLLPIVYPLVPKMLPPFADLRAITAGAECIDLGYDVLVNNPCDPWHRSMNYPRIWSFVAYLGIDQSYTNILGILIIVLYFSSIFYLIGHLNKVSSTIYYSLVLCSPTAMLAVERCNNDLIIFILLSWAILVVNKNYLQFKSSISYSIIFLASMLKLYPVFAFTILLRERGKRIALSTLAIFLGFFLYIVSIKDQLPLISKATPRAVSFSYGMKVVADVLLPKFYIFNGLNIKSINSLKIIIPLIMIFIVLLLAIKCSGILNSLYFLDLSEKLVNSGNLNAFRIGTSIFIGTFIIGNNWDYRLIFLIFTIPQLLEFMSLNIVKSRNSISKLSQLTLIVLLLTLWLSAISLSIFFFDELLNWILVYLYLLLFIMTLPKRLTQMIQPFPNLKSNQDAV